MIFLGTDVLTSFSSKTSPLTQLVHENLPRLSPADVRPLPPVEQQEVWAIKQGFDEIVVKTKNKFYEMRGTLDHLRFEVVKYERSPIDNAESKVYLSKKLNPELLDSHRSAKSVVQIAV